jgi:hypothetical protein
MIARPVACAQLLEAEGFVARRPLFRRLLTPQLLLGPVCQEPEPAALAFFASRFPSATCSLRSSSSSNPWGTFILITALTCEFADPMIAAPRCEGRLATGWRVQRALLPRLGS